MGKAFYIKMAEYTKLDRCRNMLIKNVQTRYEWLKQKYGRHKKKLYLLVSLATIGWALGHSISLCLMLEFHLSFWKSE